MPDSIILLHREKAVAVSKESPFSEGDSFVLWETCLRQIYFCDKESLPAILADDIEVYEGEQAYRFCLQITCGLMSPIVGETEVWGQFKGLFRDFEYGAYSFGGPLRKFVENIFADGKAIRNRHLKGLGSQSYGSLARRMVKGIPEVHFLGAGSLVKDMLPWLVKQSESVTLHCRQPEKAIELAESQVEPQKVNVEKIESKSIAGVLIVAAPLSADEIAQLFTLENVLMIIDLRDNSRDDLIQSENRVVPLSDFFAEISNTKQLLQQKVADSKAEIDQLSLKRFRKLIIRPYGWDDLWL